MASRRGTVWLVWTCGGGEPDIAIACVDELTAKNWVAKNQARYPFCCGGLDIQEIELLGDDDVKTS